MRTALLFAFSAISAYAQVASSSLTGTVTDPSSGVVAGTTITVSQDATGFSRATVTDSRGNYVLEDLAPGVYALTASKQGFLTYEAREIGLALNQKARQDIRLT